MERALFLAYITTLEKYFSTYLLSLLRFLLLSLLFLHDTYRGVNIGEVQTGSDEEEPSPQRIQGLPGALSDDSMLWQMSLNDDVRNPFISVNL